jgi:hypothetical protein
MEGRTQNWGCAMGDRGTEKGSYVSKRLRARIKKKKRDEKNTFEGKRGEKKLSRGNVRRNFRWIIVLGELTRHQLDFPVDGPTGYHERTKLRDVTSQKTDLFIFTAVRTSNITSMKMTAVFVLEQDPNIS